MFILKLVVDTKSAPRLEGKRKQKKKKKAIESPPPPPTVLVELPHSQK
jgi:hypothetical protein